MSKYSTNSQSNTLLLSCYSAACPRLYPLSSTTTKYSYTSIYTFISTWAFLPHCWNNFHALLIYCLLFFKFPFFNFFIISFLFCISIVHCFFYVVSLWLVQIVFLWLCTLREQLLTKLSSNYTINKTFIFVMNKGWQRNIEKKITILHGFTFFWRMMEQQQHTHTQTHK